MDQHLWKIENFSDFLEARKELLASELNRRMEGLLHGDTKWLDGRAPVSSAGKSVIGGITSEEEEDQLIDLNNWVVEQGLSQGVISYDFSDPVTGEQKAVLDLAWPNGLQEELSEPVAVLIDESSDVLAVASAAGYRCYTSSAAFRQYVLSKSLS